jgi:alpha-tubulin suppressor-like RCC1 family protein
MPIDPAAPRASSPLFLAALLAVAACKPGTEPLPPAAVQLGIAVAPAATAQSGVTLNPQPVIELQDAEAHGFAESGRTVVAVLLTPGGTLTGTLSLKTDAAGRAVFSNLALSGAVGPRQLRFDSPGLRSVTSAPIQLGAGPAVQLAALSGNLQTSVAGTAVAQAPVVRVTDESGNPVAGVPVEFAASAGGSVEGGSTTTNAQGDASPTRWTLATTIGLNTLTATSSAIPGAAASFTATGTVGPPALLTLVAGDAQTATVGGRVAIAPAVKLTDAAGHVLSGVVINFTAGSGGSVTAGNPLTDADGIATVGGWSLGLVPGDHTLTATRPGIAPVTFHATGTLFPVSALAAGDSHTCALNPSGTAFCWGNNASGQLGTGAPGPNDSLPKAVSGVLVFGSIAAGATHTCGLLPSGDAYCWGANEAGQLGDGTTTPRFVPTAVAGGFKYSALDLSASFTCGLLLDGSARCWGLGTDGQLGDGTQTSRPLPTLVGGGHVFTAISTGGADACGLEAGGALFCWGNNAFGRLGDGTTATRLLPTAVSGGLSFVAFSAGSTHTCGIAAGGAGYCWGRGLSGRLGTGTLTDQLSPAAVSGGLALSTISASAGDTCALTTAGLAYCWGFNGSGELGDGTFGNKLVPTAVLGGLTYTLIVAGSERSCARATNGGAYCWGRNDLGALGDGTFVGKEKPVGVVKP